MSTVRSDDKKLASEEVHYHVTMDISELIEHLSTGAYALE